MRSLGGYGGEALREATAVSAAIEIVLTFRTDDKRLE